MVLSVSTSDYNNIVYLLGRGERISAIKAVRTATGCGLREAKEATEELAWNLGFSEERPSSPAATIQKQGFVLQTVTGSLAVTMNGEETCVGVEIGSSRKIRIGTMIFDTDALRAVLDAADNFRQY